MPTEVARTDYGVIIHYDEWNTLELKWLPATKDATETQARDTMALFADLAEKRRVVHQPEPGLPVAGQLTGPGFRAMEVIA